MNNSYEHIIDTLTHKKYVLESCTKLIKFLYDNHRENEAKQLAIRCVNHDNSKFSKEEFDLFSSLPLEKETLKNPQKLISEDVKNVIQVHWKNNRHHPEFFSSYKDMTEIDIMEMVCDWYARSLQHETNFIEFVITRQQTRFQFDDDFFKKVLKYCNILNE